MKQIARGAALAMAGGFVVGLALLGFWLANAWENGAQANPGTAVGVDGDTTGNTATSLGTSQACVTKPSIPTAETGAQCTNTVDNDGDGLVNDGCPASGAPETGTQCAGNADNDGDGLVNDGCPANVPGPPFDIDVYVKEVADLMAFDTTFSYNRYVLTVANKNISYFLASGNTDPLKQPNDTSDSVPDISGNYQTGGFDMYGPHESGTGGVLVRLTLQAVANGVSDARLQGVILSDSAGDAIGDSNSDGYFDWPISGQIAVGVPLPNSDSDTLPDGCDNCPLIANEGQQDADGDLIGDVCDACPNDPANDADGDGVCGNVDNCPTIANADQADGDHDGRGNVCDNCPTVANADQADGDKDGRGNVCDNCPTVANADQADMDVDALGNVCDGDKDGDGFPNDREEYRGSDPADPRCNNAVNDDSADDTKVNDGCPRVAGGAENPQCANATNDDPGDDTVVNDGCPASGAAESGAQCNNSTDNDADTFVNDGCPQVGTVTEDQGQCAGNADNDGDGRVNDGCPRVGATSESSTLEVCDGVDNDLDGFVDEGYDNNEDANDTPDCTEDGLDTDGDTIPNLTDSDDDDDGDPDPGFNDGFPDILENWAGTDSLDACFDNPNDQAWPADMSNDGTCNIVDIMFFRVSVGSEWGGSQPKDPTYDRRTDLNADTRINIIDIMMLRPHVWKTCG